MNILLTGGSGFVGKSILQWFKKNTLYNIYSPTREELDLNFLTNIETYINDNKITDIIHTAAITGKRMIPNTIEDVYKNLFIFENVITAATITMCKTLIHFGSGSELGDNLYYVNENKIYHNVPKEYGAFYKHIIAKLSNATRNIKCYNLRAFGCFGEYEDENRFIKSNIIRAIRYKPIIIHQNRWFDFIHVNDIAKIIYAVLSNGMPHNDINCVYMTKYTLLDIAKMIPGDNQIIIQHKDMGISYIGNGCKLSSLTLPLDGIYNGIQYVYSQLKYQYANH